MEDLLFFVQNIADGVYNEPELVETLTHAKGIPLVKAVDTDETRPLGIPEYFLGLCATLIIGDETVAAQREEAIGPTEFAHGVAGGTEAVAHIIQASRLLQPAIVWAKFDVKNAFNSVLPQAVLDTALVFPGAANIINLCGAQPTKVTYRDEATGYEFSVMRHRGGNQGSVLFPMQYSACQRDACAKTLELHPDVLMVGILDDKYVGHQDVAVVLAAVNTYKAELAKVGLEVHKTKTQILAPAAGGIETIRDQCTAAGYTPVEGFRAVGIPVGTPAYVQSKLASMVTGELALMNKVAQLAQSPYLPPVMDSATLSKGCTLQKLWQVLQKCVASKATYRNRCIPPSVTAAQNRRFDTGIFGLACKIVNIAENDNSTVKGKAIADRILLPMKLGGGGVMSAEAVSNSAHLGGVALVAPIASTILGPLIAGRGEIAFPEYQALVTGGALSGIQGLEDLNINSLLTADEGKPHVQRAHTAKVMAQCQKDVLDGIDTPQGKADFLSGTGTGSSFLSANPSIHGHGIPDREFEVIIRGYLGAKVLLNMDANILCPHCQNFTVEVATITPSGDHVNHCAEAGPGGCRAHRTARHYLALDHLMRDLSANRGAEERMATVTREPNVAASHEEKADGPTAHAERLRMRYDGLVRRVGIAGAGNIVAFDLTVTHPNAHSKPECAAKAGTMAHVAYLAKVRKYNDNFVIPDGEFLPLAMESSGFLHPVFHKFVKDHMRLHISGRPFGEWSAEEKVQYSITISAALQRIGVAARRAYARMVIRLGKAVPAFQLPGALQVPLGAGA